MKIYSIYISTIICITSLLSCNDFLDKAPDNRAVIKDAESISELLVNAYPESNYIPFTSLKTDNSGDGGRLAVSIRKYEQAYKFEDITDIGQDTPTLYWNSCFKAIMHANIALDEIIKNNNGDEINDDYKAVYGEALMCRAYAHFMLLNLFAVPYNKSTAGEDLGIPWVEEPEKVILKRYKRETVETVYNNIVSDFERGIKYISDESYSVPEYHFNTSAAYAFGTRLYLTLGNWKKVVECAEGVFVGDVSEILRDWTGAYKSMSEDQLKSFYSSSIEKSNLLLRATVSPWSRYGDITRYGLTKEIAGNIFSAKNAAKGDFGYTTLGYISIERAYIPKFFESFRAEGMNAESGWVYTTIPLFSAEEVLFNLAEANIMLNRFDDAISNLNSFFKRRIREYDEIENNVIEERISQIDSYDLTNPKPFYSISDKQKPFIKCVLRLKRMEFINEGIRFFDIRRFHLPVTHKCVEGEDIILTENDYRKVFQIPASAIQFGITPNKR